MNDRDYSIDAYTPKEMAERVSTVGVAKGNLDAATLFMLAVLAGAFIGLGANFATIVWTQNNLGFGLSRLLGGVAFSLGLVLVIIGGAELFTGNNLMVMAWAAGDLSTSRLLRNWIIVYAGNFVGALATALGLYFTQQWSFDQSQVGVTALRIATAKVNYAFLPAFALGVFCNSLVCLAVWLCSSARTTADKVLAIVPPITAFVAAGFEHSIANMYFIPLGIFLLDQPQVIHAAGQSPSQVANLTWIGFFRDNLLPVTLGNLVGGTLMVAGVYWFVYLRRRGETP